ncbi:MAG TPA: caspase family protein [Vicinamibacterales bacterium]|jgi:hypothetical protein|nr:caspase family protein [Acidobacteriota bacterium]HQX83078.1 caspase family protein [Vicinamibacterales bacterium]
MSRVSDTGPVDRAVIVGINAYPVRTSGPLKDFTPLDGCVNDARAIADFVVRKRGFNRSQVRLLTDAAATRKAMVAALRWLVKGARPGDRLLFYYSGHGTPFPMPGPHAHRHKLHDAICPVDFDWTGPRLITDLDFEQIFEPLPEGVEFLWICDSCFSGGLARDFRTARALGRGIRTVALHHTVVKALRAARARRRGKPAGLRRVVHRLNGALIAAATVEEYSWDWAFGRPKRSHGVLTHYLLKALNAPGGRTAPLDEVVARVARTIRKSTAEYRTQHPEAMGAPAVLARPFLARPSR